MLPQSTTRRRTLRLVLAGAVLPLASVAFGTARAATLPPVEVWKSPTCGCCRAWVRYMQAAGFSVAVHDTDDMQAVKRARGVPEALQACHTAVIAGYVVEGHVPVADIQRLIVERPVARGLAVPGMPASSPGMDQPGEPYTVVQFGTPTGEQIYARH